MNGSLDLWEGATAEEVYMIAGWEQWATRGGLVGAAGLPG